MGEGKYILYTMGCRGSWPVSGDEFEEFGGQTSCYILKTAKHAVVIDCGTGLYDAGPLLEDCNTIDVFLTHVHYDHILGLLNWSVFPKEANITFYGGFRNWFGQETLNEFFRAPFWPIKAQLGPLCEMPPEGVPLQIGDGISVARYPAPHPDGASLLCVYADDKKICIMIDCEERDGLPADVVKYCDLLMYDGMYENEEYEKYVGWGHSTWQEGCRLAQQAQVKKLIISHHDPKKKDSELRELERQAREIFKNTSFARAGDVTVL